MRAMLVKIASITTSLVSLAISSTLYWRKLDRDVHWEKGNISLLKKKHFWQMGSRLMTSLKVMIAVAVLSPGQTLQICGEA